MPDLSQLDPAAWAQAFKTLGMVGAVLLALFIVCKWPPWRKTK